jgi:hypothetical protein
MEHKIPAERANSNALPPDLQAVVDNLNRSDSEAQTLLRGLSDQQANWQPRETAWSIAQCIDHLARSNTQYANALSAALHNVRAKRKLRQGPIQPGWFTRFFISTLEPPPRHKLQAPEKIIPASHIGTAEASRSFLSSQEQIRIIVWEGAALDLNRIRFRNPFVGFLRFSIGAGLLIIAAHDRRHLWQAQQVRNSATFPPN